MRNARLDEAQAGIKIARRNINNLRYTDDTILIAEREEELKRLLMRVKEESEKAVWKFNIQKTKTMASGPITSRQTEGEKWKQWQIFFSWAPKSQRKGECSHEIKRCLLLERKAKTNLDSILKAETSGCQQRFKAVVFPVHMYRCDSWIKNKAECQRTNAFHLVLEKTLESPLVCKEIKPLNPKGNPSWIFTGRTDAEAETPTLWPPDPKNWLTGKDPDAEKDWRREEKGLTEDEMVG